MGEIAEMMLEGILCEGCGVALDDVQDPDFETPGYPRYCSVQCARDRGASIEQVVGSEKSG